MRGTRGARTIEVVEVHCEAERFIAEGGETERIVTPRMRFSISRLTRRRPRECVRLPPRFLILILSRPSFPYWDPDVDWWGICGGVLK